MDSRTAYILLNMMEGVGPVGVRALAAALGSVEAILRAPPGELAAVAGVRRTLVEKIAAQRDTIDLDAELAAAEAAGARLVTPVDDEYPKALLGIHDPPLALYVRGGFHTGDQHAVAIVGTRSPSQYGLQMSERLASGLGRAGCTVVSGLARGVDTAAHRGALKGEGRTIAFIGSGLSRLYPRENEPLAEQIAAHGAVVSEFPMSRKPDRTTFAIRNRLVSGLSRGVLVIEAAAASGAMITADSAAEQGRTVFALPGRVDNPRTHGPHRLIKSGAVLVAGIDDILEELGHLPLRAAATEKAEAAGPVLTAEEAQIMKLLEGQERSVDELIRESGLAPGRINALLVGLELKRQLRMLPGRMVCRR